MWVARVKWVLLVVVVVATVALGLGMQLAGLWVPQQSIDPNVHQQHLLVALTSALEGAQLSQFEDALWELGCTEATDLAEVQEEELVAMGMKKIEAKRLMRLAQRVSE
eukprot:COSAG06_NODE_944_length_11374_cov_56.333392_3_plen_108_part_00